MQLLQMKNVRMYLWIFMHISSVMQKHPTGSRMG